MLCRWYTQLIASTHDSICINHLIVCILVSKIQTKPSIRSFNVLIWWKLLNVCKLQTNWSTNKVNVVHQSTEMKTILINISIECFFSYCSPTRRLKESQSKCLNKFASNEILWITFLFWDTSASLKIVLDSLAYYSVYTFFFDWKELILEDPQFFNTIHSLVRHM